MIQINKELKDLLFPLDTNSFQYLEQSMLEEGCREPIIVWNDVIIDGHNRYEICQKHNIEFKTISKEFDNIDDVKQWMLINQAGRRNLTEEQLKITIGRIYNNSKQIGYDRGNQYTKEAVVNFTEATSTADKIADTYNISEKSVRNYGKLAEEYDKLKESQPELFEQDKSFTQIKRELNKQERQEVPALPTDKYRVIYADPPWQYGNCGTGIDNYGPAERHYPTMSIDELCDMPIKDITEDNAVLFIWTTSPLLEESFEVIKAWGFKYKTSFVWDKIKHNFGHYNSVRHEFLLICTKGSCTPDKLELFDSVQSIERTNKHSQKPEEFRKIIDTLYTHGKKLELFARDTFKNWEVWGNEPDIR